MARRSVASLIAACRRGDPEGWDELLERYGRLIWAVAQRLGLRADEADEVFQRTWLAILEGIKDLREPSHVVSWIIAIARHQTYQMFTERSRRSKVAPLAEEMAAGFEPSVAAAAEIEMERLETAATMRDALQALDERCRGLLELLFLSDQPPEYDEISELIGLPRGSIGPTRARCLKKLKKIFSGMYLGATQKDT